MTSAWAPGLGQQRSALPIHADLVVPEGSQDHQRPALDLSREEIQQQQGRRVGPLQIVHDDQQRLSPRLVQQE